MYDRNVKPKIFTDITMPAKLSVAQILAIMQDNAKFNLDLKPSIFGIESRLSFFQKFIKW